MVTARLTGASPVPTAIDIKATSVVPYHMMSARQQIHTTKLLYHVFHWLKVWGCINRLVPSVLFRKPFSYLLLSSMAQYIFFNFFLQDRDSGILGWSVSITALTHTALPYSHTTLALSAVRLRRRRPARRSTADVVFT